MKFKTILGFSLIAIGAVSSAFGSKFLTPDAINNASDSIESKIHQKKAKNIEASEIEEEE